MAQAQLDVDMSLDVNLKYNVPSLQLYFPPEGSPNSYGSVTPQDARKF